MMQPCEPLVTAEDIVACGCDLPSESPGDEETDLEQMAAAASMIAWTLSGERYGLCSVEGERPGRLSRTNCCLSQQRGCACRPASTIKLGHAPVVEVSRVALGGVALNAEDYHLIPPNRLVRRDGGSWPSCQLLQHPDDHEDVLVVDYTWGLEVDALGRRAIGKLGCELTKACAGAACALPTGVTSVSRQGIDLTIMDPFEFLDGGKTGVYEFDLWITAVNPDKLRRRSRVFSPDVLQATGGEAAASSP